MRIFCAIRHSNDPKFFYGGLWSGNFYPALRELGNEILESQTDLLQNSRFMHIASDFTCEELQVRARTTERILDEVHAALRQGPLDLFLSYFYNAHFDPAGFDELRHLGVPSINFFCNSTYQFGHVAAVSAKADFSWHAERDARDLYLTVGGNPVWVQMAADPKTYYPLPGRLRAPSACFVGLRYADRDRLAAALINGGVSLALYGSGWEDDPPVMTTTGQGDSTVYLGRVYPQPGTTRGYLQTAIGAIQTQGVGRGLKRLTRQWRYRAATRRLTPTIRSAAKGRAENVAETFAGYELVLNFSNVWADGRPGSNLIPHVRLRDFEGPMCRTCYLTGYSDEIQEFYDVGKEIDTYRTAEELVDKTKFYLDHPDAAERLREAGYHRALRDHTWKRRFEDLFHKIGLALRQGQSEVRDSV